MVCIPYGKEEGAEGFVKDIGCGGNCFGGCVFLCLGGCGVVRLGKAARIARTGGSVKPLKESVNEKSSIRIQCGILLNDRIFCSLDKKRLATLRQH